MDFLLFVGHKSVGKTEAIDRLVNYLVNQKGFSVNLNNKIVLPNGDFRCVLDGKDNGNNAIKIIVSSAGDNPEVIDEFEQYIKDNSPCNFIIGAVRDDGNPSSMMGYFTSKIITSNSTRNSTRIEMPLAKITRRKNIRSFVLQWYYNKIDGIVNNILANKPFNI